MQDVVIGLANNVDVIENKKKITENLETKKKLAPMNYKINEYLFFGSSETVNYASVSKLLDQTYMHLVLQLITHGTYSQEFSKDLLLVLKCLTIFNCLFPFFSHCEQDCTKI